VFAPRSSFAPAFVAGAHAAVAERGAARARAEDGREAGGGRAGACAPRDVLARLDRLGLGDDLRAAIGRAPVTPLEVCSRVKTGAIAAARHRFWRRLRARGLSLSEIGALVDRDHTTVAAAVGRGVARVEPADDQAGAVLRAARAEIERRRATLAERLRADGELEGLVAALDIIDTEARRRGLDPEAW
jgi:DNA-binding transcriptional MerR regulator